jgi:hypothetical protein
VTGRFCQSQAKTGRRAASAMAPFMMLIMGLTSTAAGQ